MVDAVANIQSSLPWFFARFVVFLSGGIFSHSVYVYVNWDPFTWDCMTLGRVPLCIHRIRTERRVHVRPLSSIFEQYEPHVAGSQPMSRAVHRRPNKLWRSNSIFNPWEVICAWNDVSASSCWGPWCSSPRISALGTDHIVASACSQFKSYLAITRSSQARLKWSRVSSKQTKNNMLSIKVFRLLFCWFRFNRNTETLEAKQSKQTFCFG